MAIFDDQGTADKKPSALYPAPVTSNASVVSGSSSSSPSGIETAGMTDGIDQFSNISHDHGSIRNAVFSEDSKTNANSSIDWKSVSDTPDATVPRNDTNLGADSGTPPNGTTDPSADVEDGYKGRKHQQRQQHLVEDSQETRKKIKKEEVSDDAHPCDDNHDVNEDEDSDSIDDDEKERLLKLMEEAGKRYQEASEEEEVDLEAVIQSGLKRAMSQSYQAPDGGYGWVIVASAMVISLIVDGLTYTFGLFLGEFEKAFQQPKSTIALASSLQVGIYLMIGPVVSALTNRFGCRPVIITGSFLAGIAFAISSLSQGVTMLILTYGVLGGIGFGMMYLPAIVSVSIYFERRRAVATGIAVCGSGIGTFILAPLTEKLLEDYNWQATLLLLGGLILQGMVFGALVRPLQMKTIATSTIWSEEDIRRMNNALDEKAESESKLAAKEGDTVSRTSACSRKSETRFNIFKPRKRNVSSTSYNQQNVPLITITDELDHTTVVLGDKPQTAASTTSLHVSHYSKPSQGSPLFSSTPNMASSNSQVRQTSQSKKHKTLKTDGSSKLSLTSLGDTAQARIRSNTLGVEHKAFSQHISHLSAPGPAHHASNKGRPHAPLGLSFISLTDANVNHIREDTHIPLSRRNIHLSGTLAHPEWDFTAKAGASGLYLHSIRSISSFGSRGREKEGGFLSCLPESARDTIGEMLDFNILKNKQYWFVLMGNFFCMIGFYVPFVYIPERALQLGIEENDSAFLLSIIGITNTVGRVSTGVLINFLNIDSVLVTGIALFMSGTMTMAVPLCEGYASLAVVSAIFGLCVAAYISLCSVLLCELLGVNNLTNAFGYVILFRGVACVIGPPLAGAIIDATGVFDKAFYVGGGMIVLGAICHLVLYLLYLPCVKKRRKSRKV